MESTSRPETVFFLMRHGERIDKTIVERFKHDWSYHDPIITPDGCEMAASLGKILKDKYMTQLEEIVGGKFDSIVIESSPYLRTMMTCAWLCKGLG